MGDLKKLLALMAGPRKAQNTDALLDRFLEGVSDSGEEVLINKVYVNDIKVGYCTACDYCGEHGKCYYDDGMTKIYEEFDTSDGVVFASPIYFYGISGIGKDVIDRCQVYWSSKYVLNDSSIDRNKRRVGAFIATAGAPKKHTNFSAAETVATIFFKCINTEFKERILAPNTDRIKTWENEELMEEAYLKGKNFFEGF